jgi:sugar phosphate isomerase/epimerase
MKVGMLTAPFGNDDMDTVLDFAAEAGFDSLEIRVPSVHCDLDNVDYVAMQDAVSEAGLEISSLAAYVDITNGDPAVRQANRDILSKALDAVEKLDCDCLCCMAGIPAPGKSREQSIKEDAAPFYREFAKKAADKGVKLAMENWFATNIRALNNWEMIFNEVPAENFGLNFDPSHLAWQGIDVLAAVDKFASRIFHTHAKDVEVDQNKLAWLGNQEGGWWRYVIPGLGDIDWGTYVGRLRRNGFNGVLSIEHEDGAVGREEGFEIGLGYLRLFADGS